MKTTLSGIFIGTALVVAWLLGLWVLTMLPAEAWLQSRDSNYNKSVSAGASYTGPGDVVSGATAWYGLRAYNAAYATGSNKSINVRRASDNTTQDINILSSGALDIATANTFAGTDASCTGSMVGTTTLTISACSSGTLHVSDTLTAAGATYPFYITGIGTCASPPGTCTVNAAQTFASEAVTAQVAMFVTEAYDQSGANACTGTTACNATQGTAANQPQLLPSCINSLPCLNPMGTQTLVASNFSSLSAPVSISTVVDCIGTAASYGILGLGTSSTGLLGNCSLGASSTIATGPGGATATAAQGVWHSVEGDFVSSGTPFVNIDGVATTGSSGSPVFINNTLFAFHSGASPLVGQLPEIGIWPVAFNSTQYGNLCKNKQLYYNASNFGAAC